MHIAEELYWEAYLARVVQPDKCKLTTTSHRSEVKLTKAEKVMWDEFEVRISNYLYRDIVQALLY